MTEAKDNDDSSRNDNSKTCQDLVTTEHPITTTSPSSDQAPLCLGSSPLTEAYRRPPLSLTHEGRSYLVIPTSQKITVLSSSTGRKVRVVWLPPKLNCTALACDRTSLWAGCEWKNKAENGDNTDTATFLEWKISDLVDERGSSVTTPTPQAFEWRLLSGGGGGEILEGKGEHGRNEEEEESVNKLDDKKDNLKEVEKDSKEVVEVEGSKTLLRRDVVGVVTPPNHDQNNVDAYMDVRVLYVVVRELTTFVTFKKTGRDENVKRRQRSSIKNYLHRIEIPTRHSNDTVLIPERLCSLDFVVSKKNTPTTMPLWMHALNLPTPSPSAKSATTTFVLVVHTRGLAFVNAHTGWCHRYRTAGSTTTKDGESITCASLSPNGSLALGYGKGYIRLFHGLLSAMLAAVATSSSPSEKLTSVTPTPTPTPYSIPLLNEFRHSYLHWHVHSVRSVSFWTDDALVSGGEESVLVVWRDGKVSQTLPRMFYTAILHVSRTMNTTLVVCSAHSIKAVSAYDLSGVWSVEGLAHTPIKALSYRDGFVDETHLPKLRLCPSTGRPVVSNLGGAPGRLVTHCAEPSVSTSNFVVSSLEVVPWNRVSSSASGAEPLLPRVSFFGYDNLPIHINDDNDDDNDSGVGLVTVDHSPSEVETIGRHFLRPSEHDGGDGKLCSEHTTLKFWHQNTLVATRVNPHGIKHNVSGLLVLPSRQHSQSGSNAFVVTTSSTEHSFRIWNWKGSCLCHVDTPASLRKFPPQGAMAVSSSDNDDDYDGSVLAVAYGPMVALWDLTPLPNLPPVHLRTISFISTKSFPIRSLAFTSGSCVVDCVLIATDESVKVVSPFPTHGNGDADDEALWEYRPSDELQKQGSVRVTAVSRIVGSSEQRRRRQPRGYTGNPEVAVAVARRHDHSPTLWSWSWSIELLDESTGRSTTSQWSLGPSGDGKILSMAADRSGESLFFLTDAGQLYRVHRRTPDTDSVVSTDTLALTSLVPSALSWRHYDERDGAGTLPGHLPAPAMDWNFGPTPSPTEDNDDDDDDDVPNRYASRKRAILATAANTPDGTWMIDVDSQNLPQLCGSTLRQVLRSRLLQKKRPRRSTQGPNNDED